MNGRDEAWTKVKPDYMEELGEIMDLVVIGGFWGSGKRGGYFGSFFCGIKDDNNPNQVKYVQYWQHAEAEHRIDFIPSAKSVQASI